MISDENLEQLYNKVISEEQLVTKELNEIGFNSKDLAQLINLGVLQRVKRGYYTFVDANSLYEYAKQLMENKKYDNVMSYFEACYKIDPNNVDNNLELFSQAIYEKDYEKAFKYFQKVFFTDNEFYNTDSLLYLYMLNIITDIPKKYQEYAKTIQFNDIRVDFKDYRYTHIDIKKQDMIRSMILEHKFTYALKLFNDYANQDHKLTIQDRVLRKLLYEAAKNQKEERKKMLSYINNEEYNKLIIYIKKLEDKRGLSTIEQTILLITQDLVELIKTGRLDSVQTIETDNLYDAINYKNYDLALTLSSSYNKRAKINDKENAINLLLTKINMLEKEKNISVNLSDIVNFLKQNDFQNFSKNLKSYLTAINKVEYQFLIDDLIKISILQKDSEFLYPITVLNDLNTETYEFEIWEYIQKFYHELSLNNLKVARVYLDIISNANILGQPCILTQDLEEVLNKTEQLLNNKNNENEELLTDKQNNKTKTIVTYNDEEFIKSKIDILKKDGILLLKPMDDERRQNIHKIVNEIKYVESFDINQGDNSQVVLRYTPYYNEDFDLTSLMKKGNEAYKNMNYEQCIQQYRKVLSISSPRSFVYIKLGLCYIRAHNKELACDYLTIGNELAKQEGAHDVDYRELIAALKGLIPKTDLKPKMYVNEEEFCDDLTQNYGVENLDVVVNLMSDGMTLEEVCDKLNIEEEQKNLIALIFARNYYAENFLQQGDEYLKIVEKAKNKTKYVNDLFKEITHKKRFYSNRVNEDNKSLILLPNKKIKA